MATLAELLALLPDNTSGLITSGDMRVIVTDLWEKSTEDVAIDGNIATYTTDIYGNVGVLVDSGYDFLSMPISTLTGNAISGKLDIPTTAGVSGEFMKYDTLLGTVWSTIDVVSGSLVTIDSTSDINLTSTDDIVLTTTNGTVQISGYGMPSSIGTDTQILSVNAATSALVWKDDIDSLIGVLNYVDLDALVVSNDEKIEIPANDSSATDGQVLTKFAAGNAWTTVGGSGAPSSLDDLTDVSILGVTAQHVIIYDVAQNMFVNRRPTKDDIFDFNESDYESYLGVPTVDGQALVSLVNGNRAWADLTTDIASLSDTTITNIQVADVLVYSGSEFVNSPITKDMISDFLEGDYATAAQGTLAEDALSVIVAAATYVPQNSPTFTGTVSGISASMVGLGNVSNVVSADLPVSNATQVELDLKLNAPAGGTVGNILEKTPSGVGWTNYPAPQGFNFLGNVNPTLAPPAGTLTTGDFYISDTAGTADAGWTGIGGDTVAVDSNLIFDGTNWHVSGTTVDTTGKANKVASPVANNIVMMDSGGDIQDAGTDVGTITASITAREMALGNPTVDGQILVSTVAGVRTWVTDTVHTLESLSDSTISTPNWGDALMWNGAAWANTPSDTTIVYRGKGAYDVTNIAVSAGYFGMHISAIPAPRVIMPQSGDSYIDELTGICTTFGGDWGDRSVASRITHAVTTPTSIDDLISGASIGDMLEFNGTNWVTTSANETGLLWSNSGTSTAVVGDLNGHPLATVSGSKYRIMATYNSTWTVPTDKIDIGMYRANVLVSQSHAVGDALSGYGTIFSIIDGNDTLETFSLRSISADTGTITVDYSWTIERIS